MADVYRVLQVDNLAVSFEYVKFNELQHIFVANKAEHIL